MNNCWSCMRVFAAIWVRSPSSRTRNSWSSWSWALIPMEPWSWSWKTCGRGWRSPTSCSSRCSRRVAMWNISLKWLDVTNWLDFFLPSFLFLFTETLFFWFASAPASQIPPVPTSRSSYSWRRNSSWRRTITRPVQREPCDVIAPDCAELWSVFK